MKTELVCRGFCGVFALFWLILDAITVVPEMETRRWVTEQIAMGATVIFGAIAVLSRQTNRLRQPWIARSIAAAGIVTVVVVLILY